MAKGIRNLAGELHLAAHAKLDVRVPRPLGEIEVTALDPWDLRTEDDPSYRWTPSFELARMNAWRERGVEHVIVNMPDAFDLAKLRTFGREVIAKLG